MSEATERRLKDVVGELPRPDTHVTRAVEDRLQARLRRSRPRRLVRSGATALAGMALGVALGAGIVAVGAGAATESVSLTVRPTIVSGIDFGRSTAFGAVSNGREGEQVQLEVRECGQSAFRVNSGPAFIGTTAREGTYGGVVYFDINTSVRARWIGKDIVSEVIEVRRRPTVQLRQRSGGWFEVVVWAVRYFDGKRVRIERWSAGRWVVVRRATLRRGIAGPDAVGSEARVRVQIGRGAQMRAILPGDQARPCYVESFSRIIVTR